MSVAHDMSTDAVLQAVFANTGPWTEEQYFALPEIPARVELVDGMLLVSPLSASPHHRLVRDLTNAFCDTCPDGRWEALPGANVRLWANHVRIPDVVVVSAGHNQLYASVADVLVLVEITSPGNFRQDMIVKHGDYAEAGVPYYLRVDLHKGLDAITASAYELADGTYQECASAPDGVLRLEKPWPMRADLRAMARGVLPG